MKRLNIKKMTPVNTGVITTAERYTEEESKSSGIILSDKMGKIKDIQTIVSVGRYGLSTGLEPGMTVAVSFGRYAKSFQKKDSLASTMEAEVLKAEKIYNIPTILLDGVEHLRIDASDITDIINDFEYYDDEASVSTTVAERIALDDMRRTKIETTTDSDRIEMLRQSEGPGAPVILGLTNKTKM